MRMFVWLPQVLLAVVSDSRGVSSIGAKHTGQQQQTFTWPCEMRSSAHTHMKRGKRTLFPGSIHWMARSPWQQDHFISRGEQMVCVQQATYVPMSRGHYYRWRVGRRPALKHNLTFPPHLAPHCYVSQREISPKRWIAAQNLFKGKLLRVPRISPHTLLNQARRKGRISLGGLGLFSMTDIQLSCSPWEILCHFWGGGDDSACHDLTSLHRQQQVTAQKWWGIQTKPKVSNQWHLNWPYIYFLKGIIHPKIVEDTKKRYFEEGWLVGWFSILWTKN